MNSSNIYVPNKINVGFQNREGTYTGKLAYVIYYDEKGKLRKEASWNSWRDQEIPNEEYENIPTEGFVLNKKVGGVEESWGYDPRRTYTRVYDPRGFEFEITIPNLLWLLENCNCIKGKGLEGEFVYGWDSKDLLLIPVDSPEYKTIKAKSEAINNKNYIKAADLILGATYQGKNEDKWYVYLGRFDAYKKNWNSVIYDYWNSTSWRRSKEDDGSWLEDPFDPTKYKYVNRGKYYWFMECEKSSYLDNIYEQLVQIKSVNNRFIKCSNNKCHEKYAEYLDKMESSEEFSPIDYKNVVVKDLPYQAFEAVLIKLANGGYCYDGFYSQDKNQFGCYKGFHIRYHRYDRDGFYADFNGRKYQPKVFGHVPEDTTFRKIYDEMHPVYGIYYLKNGKEFKKEGWYEDGTE